MGLIWVQIYEFIAYDAWKPIAVAVME